MPISLQTVFANAEDEEAYLIGEQILWTEEEWRAEERNGMEMPCPNGKTWGECSEAERAEYQRAKWWYMMRDWVAWQTKH